MNGGRSKRLCTGFGNASEPGFTSRAREIPSEQSSSYSSSTVDFDHVQSQTLFQSHHHNAPSLSPDHAVQHEVVGATPSTYNQSLHVQSRLHFAYDPPYPLSSAVFSQPIVHPDIPHEGTFPDRCHQPDVRTKYQHECQHGSTSNLEKNGDTGHEDTSYELCLGLINTATLRVSSATLETIPAGRSVVNLIIQGPVTTVHSAYKISTSDYMGLLDHETASALGKIYQEYDVDPRAYILHDRTCDSKSSSVTWGASIPIYIVLYSHSQESELLGQSLSENNIFLQHPQHKEDLKLYKNPQYLVFPGEEYPSIDCIDAENSTSWVEPSHERDVLNKNQLDSVFESAQGPDEYSIIESSPRLRTTLQPHQRKGLAMMHEKESGSLQNNDFMALWSQTSTSNGRVWYKNCVTGAVRENPELSLGGLLADEMGLGKSLTVIALIAGTLDAMAIQPMEERLHSPLSQAGKCNKTTLIVTPKSTLHSWKEQFDSHTKFGKIQVYYYSGNKRKSTVLALLGYDVIVTTYGTLTAENNRRSKKSCDEDQPLLANYWLRVVLDEAHVIRNASTKQFATVCALNARHRWVLSGTPIQNSVEDFGTLLQFLRVYPFDNPSSFTHEIADWIRCGDEKGMKRLRLLVSAVCLRRTKECLGLPPRGNEIHSVAFNKEEKHLYEMCKQSTVESIEFAFNEDGRLKSFATVIQLILRLRQICNHGKDMLSTKTLKNLEDFRLSQGSKGEASTVVETARCGICGRKVQELDSMLPCMHPACSSCVEEKEMMASKGELECSICAGTDSSMSNSDLRIDKLMPDAMMVDYKPSSKVAALIKNLLSNEKVKSVIFSYWTKMLDLIGQALDANDIRFERLDGQMSTPQRREAILNFRKDPKCTVFLATVGSAGVGIDLTVACRVHLMEPQWNPMAEEQALDRVHRIGQSQPVIATRYIVSDSVEEYVVSLQRKKMDLIQQSLGSNAAPPTNALKERLKNLHDFLTSSPTSAVD